RVPARIKEEEPMGEFEDFEDTAAAAHRREMEEMHAAYEEMDMNELTAFMAEMDEKDAARDAERDRD
ncbi:hypothetical protein, partial [Streptomyces sp. SID3343]|uniref:hypothetical protein n=1 Tax=Streptomyces sp. SID3343 TaxID=2690260 RepID=UPI001F47C623